MAEDNQLRFTGAVRLHSAGQLAAARDAYLALIADGIQVTNVAANLCALFLQAGDVVSSERYGRMAVECDPRNPDGWNHLGLALKARGAAAEAAAAFQRCLSLDQRHGMAWYNIGELRAAKNDTVGSADAYSRSLAVQPDYTPALVAYLHRKQQIVDWNGLDTVLARISKRIAAGDCIDPFALLFCCTDPAELLKAANNCSAQRERETKARYSTSSFGYETPKHERVRVGYVSANFYDHAVGTLICQLLETHDRSRFEVFCYCHSEKKTGLRRERIKRASDHFIEIDRMDDAVAAQRIHADGVDILVDLMGYTKGRRLGIFDLRPAPLQVTWIGFAGTVGGSSMDYIVADRVVIPKGDERFYTEAVLRMPVCYQVNDSTRELSDKPMSRRDFGIGDEAVIYCCFNQTAKITPPMMTLWAQIIKEVPNSVLWLWALYKGADEGLRKAFAAASGDPARLRFGETLPEKEHLSRYGLCDLFLDTFPYGGHATASKALFGGCPLLALPGRTFASRVSSSLLTALGMTELIASSPQEYVQKAIRIGRDPELRRSLKEHLIAARASSPLFDGARFARDLERAFEIMVQRHRGGEKPSAIDLK